MHCYSSILDGVLVQMEDISADGGYKEACQQYDKDAIGDEQMSENVRQCGIEHLATMACVTVIVLRT